MSCYTQMLSTKSARQLEGEHRLTAPDQMWVEFMLDERGKYKTVPVKNFCGIRLNKQSRYRQ